MSMFCYQCEQTSQGTGCVTFGVCGKDPETAALQDLLVHAAMGLASWADRLETLGEPHRAATEYVLEALFTTVTNVNFDPERLAGILRQGAELRDEVRQKYNSLCLARGLKPDQPGGAAVWTPAPTLEGLIRQGEEVSIPHRMDLLGKDLVGLGELLLYGLKGTAAYAVHARILGQQDPEVDRYFLGEMRFLGEGGFEVNDLLARCLRCGEWNLKVMELLDRANTGAYGHPVPTPVRITPVKGKAIVVSGHDLKDLEELLKQTEGKGINIYTHGEMLPAHGYPGLKKYPHLVGNYGGAWQDQAREFDAFPGAILMTTNCIQKPKETYKARIFTTGLVAWPGVTHCPSHDFSEVIQAALEAPGFTEDAPEKTVLVGFGHNAVLNVADQVIAAVKSGAIRHFFLIGGCDGAKLGRDYYTEMAASVPKDAVILTLACGKYRFYDQEFGTIGGIPRLLDMGQCNDAYSAIRVAGALAEAFGCTVNELPLSFILSWYEQKAVCILLTLLHLGIKNIRLGPSLPAFLTPPVIQVLVEKFGLTPIGTVKADLEACLTPA
jgi:hydroxylamine reductase